MPRQTWWDGWSVVVQLWRNFSWVIPVVAVLGGGALLLTAYLSWSRTGHERSWPAARQALLDGLVALWGVAVALITLVPGASPSAGRGPSVELVPFGDLVPLLTDAVHWEVPFVQIGGNLVLFAAGGLLLGLRHGLGAGRAVLTFLAVGVGIETWQLIVGGRSAVLDDVLLCVLGGALGAWAGRALARTVRHPAPVDPVRT
ncbi:VanZ like protein [Cellulomonas sp. SLBN-39]|nr:VanZ like protein [Cellulomonas sp. SLBN-39]